MKPKLVVVTLSSHSLLIIAPPRDWVKKLIAFCISGTSIEGLSVKSRIVRILPSRETVSIANALNRMTPLTPTLGYCEPLASIEIGYNVCPLAELTSLIASDPLASFCGAKKAQTPLLPAGQAMIKRGPMAVKSLSGRGGLPPLEHRYGSRRKNRSHRAGR